MKYVAVTGGVVSGLGKGITSSSIGVLLKASGLHVTSIKIDPYLVSAITHLGAMRWRRLHAIVSSLPLCVVLLPLFAEQ